MKVEQQQRREDLYRLFLKMVPGIPEGVFLILEIDGEPTSPAGGIASAGPRSEVNVQGCRKVPLFFTVG
jgi:hypothetical protein